MFTVRGLGNRRHSQRLYTARYFKIFHMKILYFYITDTDFPPKKAQQRGFQLFFLWGEIFFCSFYVLKPGGVGLVVGVIKALVGINSDGRAGGHYRNVSEPEPSFYSSFFFWFFLWIDVGRFSVASDIRWWSWLRRSGILYFSFIYGIKTGKRRRMRKVWLICSINSKIFFRFRSSYTYKSFVYTKKVHKIIIKLHYIIISHVKLVVTFQN